MTNLPDRQPASAPEEALSARLPRPEPENEQRDVGAAHVAADGRSACPVEADATITPETAPLRGLDAPESRPDGPTGSPQDGQGHERAASGHTGTPTAPRCPVSTSGTCLRVEDGIPECAGTCPFTAAPDGETPAYAWAQGIYTIDGGRTIAIPGIHHGPGGEEERAVLVSGEDVAVLRDMLDGAITSLNAGLEVVPCAGVRYDPDHGGHSWSPGVDEYVWCPGYADTPPTRVRIDLNVRLSGGRTRVGLEDADGPLTVGQPVEVYEAETGLHGPGRVTGVDEAKRLAYIAVPWGELREADDTDATEETGRD